jgi:starch-binding outer membrane protein, SusD/RagB family
MLRLLRRVTPATLVVAAAACGLLDTDQPNIVEPGDLDSPAGANARRVGAISDFGFAKDGDGDVNLGRTDGQVLLSGLMADEFVLSTTPPTEQEVDQRRMFTNNSTIYDLYWRLQRARAAAEDAAAALQLHDPTPDEETPDVGEMLSLAGFSYVFFGEDFCSGVPASRLEGDTIAFGKPQTTAETFDTAVARFDAALTDPGVATPSEGHEEDALAISYLASVGKGRALLDLGDFTGAAAAVAAVPTDFVYASEHSSAPARLQNAIYNYSTGFLWSLSDQEGCSTDDGSGGCIGVGLPFRTANDPRVPFEDPEDVGLDGSTPQFTLLKYGSNDAGVTVADGIEARLIEAEAALRAQNLAGMTDILNALRDLQGLDPLAVPGTFDEGVDQLFSERAFWMFATGHRLGDLRRLIRQYDRTQAEVFPSGSYVKGGSYGTDVNIPLPLEVENNPNSHGCLDRNA